MALWFQRDALCSAHLAADRDYSGSVAGLLQPSGARGAEAGRFEFPVRAKLLHSELVGCIVVRSTYLTGTTMQVRMSS